VANWLLLVPIAWLSWLTLQATSGFTVQTVERGERVPWTRARLSALAREVMLNAFYGLIRPAGAFRSPPSHVANRPVLLIPPPESTPLTVAFLLIYLRHHGHRANVVHFSTPRGDLADHAKDVEALVTSELEAVRSDRVDLIGLGGGGLVAAWYVRHLGGDLSVRQLVTIGTPWRGTRMAAFLPEPESEAFQTASHLLDGLLPAKVPVTSIWSPDSPMVVPAQHAIADEERAIAIEGTGHLGLSLSTRVFRSVRRVLISSTQSLPEAL